MIVTVCMCYSMQSQWFINEENPTENHHILHCNKENLLILKYILCSFKRFIYTRIYIYLSCSNRFCLVDCLLPTHTQYYYYGCSLINMCVRVCGSVSLTTHIQRILKPDAQYSPMHQSPSCTLRHHIRNVSSHGPLFSSVSVSPSFETAMQHNFT